MKRREQKNRIKKGKCERKEEKERNHEEWAVEKRERPELRKGQRKADQKSKQKKQSEATAKRRNKS